MIKPRMAMRKIVLLLTCILSLTSFAQNLLTERIWKISTKKRSIFFDNGVFHAQGSVNSSELVNVRSSYVKSRGYERLVFDFAGAQIPKIYGYISKKDKKLFIDFFSTTMSKVMNAIDKVKYVDEINFFNMDRNMLSIEVAFKEGVSLDVFYLANPARFVVDIKR
jgi:hypothetical protein